MENSKGIKETLYDRPKEELFDMVALEARQKEETSENVEETPEEEIQESTEVEETHEEDVEEKVETSEPEVSVEEEQKMVSLKALQEARSKNKKLRDLITQKDQEIGKYQYLSTPRQQEVVPIVEEDPFDVLSDLQDDDPITAGEFKQAWQKSEEIKEKKRQASMSTQQNSLAQKQMLKATEEMTEEVMGEGLGFKEVYDRLVNGEIQLTRGQSLDIQDAMVNGQDAAKLMYDMVINTDPYFIGLKKTTNDVKVVKKAISTGKKPSPKKEDLTQNDILKITRSESKHNRDMTDYLFGNK